MEKLGYFPHLFAILALILLAELKFTASQVSNMTICREEERNALTSFQRSLLDSSSKLLSWRSEERDCCKWLGVTCNKTTGHVVKLGLRNDPLSSPSSLLSAFQVDSSLMKLTQLEYLDLSGNFFNSSQIPNFLGNFRNLNYLNLSSAGFSGKIPHFLGFLRNLRVLDLSVRRYNYYGDNSVYYNNINNNDNDYDNVRSSHNCSRELFVDDFEWVSKLSSLIHLDLSGVFLGNSLNIFGVLNNLPNLSFLGLSECELNNSHLPSFSVNSSLFLPRIQFLLMEWNSFSGLVPTFFQNMTSLRELDLSFNLFKDNLPIWLGKFRNLQYLHLCFNYFNGGIPFSVGNLTSLEVLFLDDNQLSGSIPESVGKLSRLKNLYLSFNTLTSSIPTLVSNLTSLEKLDFSNNQLSGRIPAAIGELSRLRSLTLSSNNLSGIFPKSVGRLAKLEKLRVSYNSLEGIVSEEHMANLSGLIYLALCENRLEFKVKPGWIPPFNLQFLYAGSSKMGPDFPEWLLTQKEASVMELADNGFSGTIPVWLEGRNLEYLDLSNNQLSGSLPQNLETRMPRMDALLLMGNLFNGSLPDSLCKMRNLTFLDLSENKMSGKIPGCLSENPNLVGLIISSNDLSGFIPNSFVNLSALQYLRISDNHFVGNFPFFLRNCKALQILDLSENQFSGKIKIGSSFRNLKILRLRKNSFNGEIPSDLCELNELQILDLAGNDLVGTIPPCLGNLERMKSIQLGRQDSIKCLSYKQDCLEQKMEQVIKGTVQNYTKNLKFFVNIDFSDNNLDGEIPEEITNLIALVGLNLSYNQLSGILTRKVGNMKSLESLDLSNNGLSGKIPATLSELTSLSHLNLSKNRFSGRVPNGNQLQTLNDPSIYDGNPDLCGNVLQRKCTEEDSGDGRMRKGDENGEDEGDETVKCFIAGGAAGFSIGFCGVVGVLTVKKKWRDSCFNGAEQAKDRIYLGLRQNFSRMKKTIHK